MLNVLDKSNLNTGFEEVSLDCLLGKRVKVTVEHVLWSYAEESFMTFATNDETFVLRYVATDNDGYSVAGFSAEQTVHTGALIQSAELSFRKWRDNAESKQSLEAVLTFTFQCCYDSNKSYKVSVTLHGTGYECDLHSLHLARIVR